jgi:hypothetical protein
MGRDSACLRARASAAALHVGEEAARHPFRLGCHGKRGELAGGGQQACGSVRWLAGHGGAARPSLRVRRGMAGPRSTGARRLLEVVR